MKSRHGFTLVELMVAMVILVLISTGIARFSASFSRSMSDAGVRVVAAGVASDRLEIIRADPRYTSLVSLYNTGAGADTTGFPDYPRMRRLTSVVRDQSGTPARDRTTVTVRVFDPSLKDTLALTAVIASP